MKRTALCRTRCGSRGSQVRIPRTHKGSCHNKVDLFKRVSRSRRSFKPEERLQKFSFPSARPPEATKQLLPTRRYKRIIQKMDQYLALVPRFPEVQIVPALEQLVLWYTDPWRPQSRQCVWNNLREMRKNSAPDILFRTLTTSRSIDKDLPGFSNLLFLGLTTLNQRPSPRVGSSLIF